jgi:ABC-type polysaccharide/polyol phosphate export permease
MKDSLVGADATLLRTLRQSVRNPAFWGYSTWLDIVIRYRRSVLGLAWLLLPPAMYMLGMGYIYAQLQGRTPLAYMPHMGLGYVLFRTIAMVVIESTSVLPAHAGYILDGNVRLTDYVLRVVFKAVFYLLVSMVVVVPVLLASPVFHPEGVPLALLGLLLVVLNLVWLGGVVSLFGARFPDTHEFMGNAFMFGFLVTPILWYGSSAPPDTVIGFLMRLNPCYHLLEVVRAPLLGDPIAPGSLEFTLVLLGVGWLLWAWVFRRYGRYVALWI